MPYSFDNSLKLGERALLNAIERGVVIRFDDRAKKWWRTDMLRFCDAYANSLLNKGRVHMVQIGTWDVLEIL